MKNKILAISIIFILLSFVLINNCFAILTGELFVTINDTEYDVSEVYGIFSEDEPFVVYVASSGYFYTIRPVDASYMHHISIDSNGYISYFNSSNQKASELYYYKQNPDTLMFDYDFKASQSDKNELSKCTILYASQGVYNSDHETFFMNPPAPTTLAGVLEATNPTGVWKTLMKNVVASLLVFLVGLVAFLKAWDWLKTQLHKA